MKSDAYKVEPDALNTAATDISDTRRLIDEHRGGLDRSTTRLLTLWTGDASQAWGRTQTGWQAELAETMAAGTALAAALRASADAYVAADEAVGRAWSI
jgi:WXG100 family type VII secretion target